MFPALQLNDFRLVNGRTLSFRIDMFDNAAVFHGMINPQGEFIYRHLIVRTEGHNYETVPVF